MHFPEFLMYSFASVAVPLLTWRLLKPLAFGRRASRSVPATLGANETTLELERLRIAERREIREQQARLASEKLDVLKTAVAMGYGQQQLAELDARLTQHIGEAGLKMLLDGEIPAAMGAQDLDPAVEAARLHRTASAQR
jgi:hypothetical protein